MKLPKSVKVFLPVAEKHDLDEILERLYAGEPTVKKAKLVAEDWSRQYRCDQETPPDFDIYEITVSLKKVKL